jgi:hypothetical protein
MNISNRTVIDNPLLPRAGVPITADDFVDSTERIINATNTNDVRYDNINNTWNVDPGNFYDTGIGSGPSNKNDLGKFNIVFDRKKEIAKEAQRIKDLNKLSALSEETKPVSPYNLSLFQIIVNTKDAWFNLMDDLLDQRFEIETFTKENRLFYIGITILVFATILYCYAVLSQDTVTKIEPEVQKIYYIYQYPGSIQQYPGILQYPGIQQYPGI